MNNSINYSHFSDLLVFEYSKEKDIHQSELTSPENTLSIDDQINEMDFLHADSNCQD